MDFSKLTKEELYKIAKDENYRMIERYSVARELQKCKGKDEICRY